MTVNKPLEASPAQEYAKTSSDSLHMFGAAIGGAIIGWLLALLTLAVINDGTLYFVG